MRNILTLFNHFYKKNGFYKLFIVAYFLWIAFSYTYLFIDILFIKSDFTRESLFKDSFFSSFLLIVIFGPLIETLLNQKLIITLLRPRIKSWSIVVSGFVFALLHLNVNYFIYFFIFGVLLATFYYYFKYYTKKRAFLITFSFHALWNLFILLIYQFVD